MEIGEPRRETAGAQTFHAVHELAREHGHAGRPQRAALGRGRRLSSHRLFHPARALGAKMAGHARAVLVFYDGGWRSAALSFAAGLNQYWRGLHAVRPDR